MKKILLIFALLFIVQGAYSQNSSLTIFSEDGDAFYLILNGIRQNDEPETNIQIVDLRNEYYSAKIIFDQEHELPIEKKHLMLVDANGRRGEMTYKIKRHKKKNNLVLRYYSFTEAAQCLPPPSYVTVVNYTSKPKPDIVFATQTTTTTTTIDDNYDDDNVNVSINLGGISIGANVNVDGDYEETTTTTTTTTSTTVVSGTPQVYEEVVYVEDVAPCGPLNHQTYNTALSSIEEKVFSETMMSQAKLIVSSNCMDVVQLKGIAKLFDFENDRLEFAKYAYAYCYDQNNYWQMSDVFDFSASVTELNDYTRN